MAFVVFSCKNNNGEKDISAVESDIPSNYTSIGDKISNENVLSNDEMAAIVNTLKKGDTINVKFASKVNSVCQNKGCWMRMDIGGQEAMVKFKDYGFFMPKDIAGDIVIISGKAFIEETSIEVQRHYAEDAGKSQEEVAAINTSEKTLSIISNGVLLPEND